MPKDKFLTVEDIAEYLKLKPLTVRQMFRIGKLRGFKLGKSWRTTESLFIEDLNKIAKEYGITINLEPKGTLPKSKKKAQSDEELLFVNHTKKRPIKKKKNHESKIEGDLLFDISTDD